MTIFRGQRNAANSLLHQPLLARHTTACNSSAQLVDAPQRPPPQANRSRHPPLAVQAPPCRARNPAQPRGFGRSCKQTLNHRSTPGRSRFPVPSWGRPASERPRPLVSLLRAVAAGTGRPAHRPRAPHGPCPRHPALALASNDAHDCFSNQLALSIRYVSFTLLQRGCRPAHGGRHHGHHEAVQPINRVSQRRNRHGLPGLHKCADNLRPR